MIQPWPLVRSRVEVETRIFRVKTETARSPRTGREHDFYVLEAGDWVNVIPLTPAEEVLLVRQYRHGTKAVTCEIPGGLVEAGQSPAEAAAQELLEETGYAAGELVLLGRTRPNPAFLSNWCYSFLALEVRPAGQARPDETEDLELVRVNVAQIPQMITQGEIDHALVLAAFFHYFMGYCQGG